MSSNMLLMVSIQFGSDKCPDWVQFISWKQFKSVKANQIHFTSLLVYNCIFLMRNQDNDREALLFIWECLKSPTFTSAWLITAQFILCMKFIVVGMLQLLLSFSLLFGNTSLFASLFRSSELNFPYNSFVLLSLEGIQSLLSCTNSSIQRVKYSQLQRLAT